MDTAKFSMFLTMKLSKFLTLIIMILATKFAMDKIFVSNLC